MDPGNVCHLKRDSLCWQGIEIICIEHLEYEYGNRPKYGRYLDGANKFYDDKTLRVNRMKRQRDRDGSFGRPPGLGRRE